MGEHVYPCIDLFSLYIMGKHVMPCISLFSLYIMGEHVYYCIPLLLECIIGGTRILLYTSVFIIYDENTCTPLYICFHYI